MWSLSRTKITQRDSSEWTRTYDIMFAKLLIFIDSDYDAVSKDEGLWELSQFCLPLLSFTKTLDKAFINIG